MAGFQNNASPMGWGNTTPPVGPTSQQFMGPMGYQQVPATQPAPFVGRYIDDIRNVVPNEVPMDGRAAIFPKSDLTEIYLKAWNANGEMKNFRYILDTSSDLNAVTPPQDDMQSQILARLDQLEQQIRENTKPNPRSKSEGGGK